MKISHEKVRAFRRMIWHHYRKHGRDLPWRRTRDPYKILISEVMLQQTRSERVLPKYTLFLKRFPGFRHLARARLSEILSVWHGLGYNRRALLLKKMSEKVMREYGGRLPHDPTLLLKLPGVGRATAGAISVFSFGKPVPFVETNIRRVFLHFFFPRKKGVGDDAILKLVSQTIDRRDPREWYFALMDYGALLSLRLSKGSNPNRRSAHYIKQSPFPGSNRELRGKIIGLLVAKGPLSPAAFRREIRQPQKQLQSALSTLEREGFIRRSRTRIRLA